MAPVAVYQLASHRRSRIICDAFVRGIRACGDRPLMSAERAYKAPIAKLCAFYGFEGNLPRIMDDYAKVGSAVFADLGYFGRHLPGRWRGYHKLTVNSRHPEAYFQNRKHPADRIARFEIEVKPWKCGGRHILVAGMGDRAAQAVGLHPEEWERKAIAELKRFTDRPIVYRPKPTWPGARPIDGVEYSRGDLREALRDCWAVVTRHSNTAIDALIEGIPAFCWYGAAVPMSSAQLGRIEAPFCPDNREQWLADLAYTQWNLAEIQNGQAWRHLRNEGLLCD